MNAVSHEALPDESLAGFEEAYARETHELLVQRLRIALSVGLVLYGLFWALDWIVLPHLGKGLEVILSFGAIRALIVLLSLGTVAAVRTERGRQRALPLSVGILTLASWGISAMTVPLGGWSSDYYIGNLLVLFFVGLFMPWSPWVAALFCLLLAGGYFTINLLAWGPDLGMLNPAFFLAGTCAYTLLAVQQSERWRRRELAFRLRMEQVNQELRSLDAAKTRFFANVSHELRTPLMLILGPLEAILSGRERGDPRPLLEAMSANAQRLLRQVNMILNYARLEAGRLELDAQPANLGQLLQQLLTGAAGFARSRSIELRAEGLDGLPDALFDLEKVETVAANLLSNALKFTPEGGRITVRAGIAEGRLWFEVEDTGVGIPEDQQDLVFERFHQVEGDLKGKSQGTGLGLSLARELMRLHDGDLTLRSEPGVGSTFRAEMPLRAAGEAAGEPLGVEETPVRRRALLADLQEKRLEAPVEAPDAPEDAPLLLLVEDNADLRNFLVRSLRSRYRLATAEDGRAGLEKARRLRPDLIVSDWMMPVMTGEEMLRELRDDPACQDIPVMFLTARSGVDSVVQGLSLGATDYLTKPFRIEELEARIEAQLRMRAAEIALDERNSRLVAIGQMTSTIAHDLKGPLTVVSGRIGLLRMIAAENPALGDLEQDLRKAEDAADRVAGMVQELSEFVRDAEIRLRTRPADLGETVRGTLEEHRSSLEAAGITLELALGADDLAGEFDADRLRRVLENLLFNARDALTQMGEPPADPRIRIEAGRDGEDLWLRVADNGPGVPATLRSELFLPFTTQGKSHGTGLGLAIVRNIVLAHAGRVEHEGAGPLGGASFLVRVPRRPPREEPASLAAAS